MQKVRERAAAIETELLFFELEWNEVDDEPAAELLASDELDRWRHHLTNLRRYRPHQLTEPEERVLTETDVTGRSAFARLFTEQTSAITVDVPDAEEPLQLMEALSVLQGPDRDAGAKRPRGSPRRSSPTCARARSSSTPCLPTRRPGTGCAPTTTGSPRATSPTRPRTSRLRR